MTVVLDLKPTTEDRIKSQAAEKGMEVDTFLKEIIERHTSVAENNERTRALLREWAKEDETDDLEEIARGCAEWDELEKGLNANRLSDRRLF